MNASILTSAYSAETKALSKAIKALRATPDGLKQMSQQMELLTARCAAYPQETRQLWDWFEAQQPGMGLDDDDFRAVLGNQLPLLDDRIRLVNKVQTLATEIHQGNDLPAYEDRLGAALMDLLGQQSRLINLLGPWTSTYPLASEPNWTSADCRAAFERGEYETTEAIMASLEADGYLGEDDDE